MTTAPPTLRRLESHQQVLEAACDEVLDQILALPTIPETDPRLGPRLGTPVKARGARPLSWRPMHLHDRGPRRKSAPPWKWSAVREWMSYGEALCR